MRKKILVFFATFFFLFYIKNSVYGQQHQCNERCDPGSCVAGLKCIGGRCRNERCTTQRDCGCEPYRIQGRKFIWQANTWQEIEPAISQNVTIQREDDQYNASSIENPYFFQGPPPTPGVAGSFRYRVSVTNPPGTSVAYTICYNNWQCYATITPTPGNSVTTNTNDADSRNYVDGDHYVSIRWYFTPLIANCSDLRVRVNNQLGQTTILKGDQVTLLANFSSGNGTLNKIGLAIVPNNCSDPWLYDYQVDSSTGGEYQSGQFIFDQAGTYKVFCRAWSQEGAECRGSCVNNPPQYKCAGSDGSGAGTYTEITVENPDPWYKLKNASLNKIGDHKISVVQNVKKFSDNDPDDTLERYVIINNAGVLLAANSYNPGPYYNPINVSNINQYQGNYGFFNKSFLSAYYQYITSRKLVREISNITQITVDGLFLMKTNSLTLNVNPPNYNFVLLIRKLDNSDYGDLTIDLNNFGNTGKSYAFIAKNIIINSGTQTINGIFISTNNFSYQNLEGLKINGNLISLNQVPLNNRSDNSRPSLFINFNPRIYLDLLPFLSISKYDWQQVQ